MESSSFFSEELRRLRDARNWTREELAQRMNFSRSAVEKVELGKLPASEDFAKAADRAFGFPDEFADHFERARKRELQQSAVPDWFRSYYDNERDAARIWWFALSVIPGLLQVEEYAHALLGSEARVAARLQRQEILTRDNPPDYVAIIDERALRYPVGGDGVMHAQLEHISTMAERFKIHVLPADCGTYVHLDGTFGIITLDGQEFAYADTPLEGLLRSEPQVVSSAKECWGDIMAEALPRRQSLELLREVAKQWT